jgi:hypothetical protein
MAWPPLVTMLKPGFRLWVQDQSRLHQSSSLHAVSWHLAGHQRAGAPCPAQCSGETLTGWGHIAMPSVTGWSDPYGLLGPFSPLHFVLHILVVINFDFCFFSSAKCHVLLGELFPGKDQGSPGLSEVSLLGTMAVLAVSCLLEWPQIFAIISCGMARLIPALLSELGLSLVIYTLWTFQSRIYYVGLSTCTCLKDTIFHRTSCETSVPLVLGNLDF